MEKGKLNVQMADNARGFISTRKQAVKESILRSEDTYEFNMLQADLESLNYLDNLVLKELKKEFE